ncbi:hypothetical protein AX16_010701 [Volvariella volvacea WC 439]|nr:hypothetical protein AX16_010701 [Volvariella volvacea WC 439]
MATLGRRQPFRTIYLTYQALATLFFWTPVWLLFALPRSWRPRHSWEVRRVYWLRFLRHLQWITHRAGPIIVSPNHLAITPGLGFDAVWVEPVPELVTGDLKKWAAISSVEPIHIPGYWLFKQGSSITLDTPPLPGEKVILALHGGAYIRLSAHPSDPTAAIARGLLKHVGAVQRVFSVEYRLSSTKPDVVANPFPAALLDALAAYSYLVSDVGFSPSDVIIEGDSAGGNLAHALTRYLVEHQGTPGLPAPPSALLLLSPWVDIGVSHDTPKSSAIVNAHTDYISIMDKGVHYARDAFLGPHGMKGAEINKYISPASLSPSMSISFIGFPRTFIVSGGAEVLVDQIRTFRERMIRDLGEGNGTSTDEGKVRYYEAPDAVHDYLVFRWHEPERGDTLCEIARWIAAV